MKAGTRFEMLTEKIFARLIDNPKYEKVEHDVKLEGKDGRRQIDVLITSQAAGIEIKTIIECKDYKGKVSVGVIDGLHSVMEDVNANKGVVVSSNGFSSTAISKAKRLGISLYTAHEALSDKWKLDIEIPILVTEISSVNAIPRFNGYLKKGTSLSGESMLHINDVSVIEEFSKHLRQLTPDDFTSLKKEGNCYQVPNIESSLFIRDTAGNKIIIDDFTVTYDVNMIYYFGYLNDQKDVLALKNILDDGFSVTFKSEFLIDYEKTLTKITKDEIPSFGKARIECVTQPEFGEFKVGPLQVNKIARPNE